MSLISITVQGYRAFKERATLEVRPLTLIFGHNNAGKSSLARLAPSIARSMSLPAGVAFSPVTLSGAISTFKDISYGKGASTFSLEVAFEIPGARYSAAYEFLNIAEASRSLVARFSLSKDDKPLLDMEWTAASRRLEDAYSDRLHPEAGEMRLGFSGILPTIIPPGISPAAEMGLRVLSDQLGKLSSQAHWLGPLRHTPERFERYTPGELVMSPTGREASQLLARSRQDESPLYENVSRWFQEALRHSLTVIEGAFDADALFGLALSPIQSPSIRIPIGDTGTGIAQVLPVLVLGEMAALGQLGLEPTLVFENPELHLHDSLHDDLARFFVRLVKSPSCPRVIIETHSEVLLLAMQIHLAATDLRADQLCVNWVRAREDGTSAIDHVWFDSRGVPSREWPAEAFTTAPTLAKRLFSLRTRQM